jgi:O-antigen ligase
MILVNIQKNILFNVVFAMVLWLLFCVSFSVWFDTSSLFKISCLFLFGVTLLRPLWGIGIFLICMPFWGGSRPEDAHTVHFYILLSTLDLAGGLYFFIRSIRTGELLRFDFSHPLFFALLIYWLVAAFSLSTIQPNDIVYSIFQFKSPLTGQFLNLNEANGVYPWLAFYALTASMFFGLLIINLAQSTTQALRLVLFFLLGMLLTIFLGLLDYYDVINLNVVRPSYVGENFRFQHLTSVFGNPGWYAQYLVLGAPALMSVLALCVQKKYKIFLLICLMVLTEFCIILIYQRGGWLSYPLTLVIIWFCVYVLDGGKKNFSSHIRAIGASLLRVAITLPLTIAISLSLVYLTTKVQSESRQQLSGYVSRAQSIANVNDRLRYWEPAFLMARLHPFFGPGVESFASQYTKLYLAPGHKYKQTPEYDIMPSYGSAHNLYFQALGGKGFLGLLSLFGVFFAAVFVVLRGISSPRFNLACEDLPRQQRMLLMITLAYTFALSIYGGVGEIFYSPIGYVLFTFFFCISIGAVPAAYRLSKRFIITVLAFLFIALAAHLSLEFGFLPFVFE